MSKLTEAEIRKGSTLMIPWDAVATLLDIIDAERNKAKEVERWVRNLLELLAPLPNNQALEQAQKARVQEEPIPWSVLQRIRRQLHSESGDETVEEAVVRVVAERDEANRKRDAMSNEWKTMDAELRHAKAQLAVVQSETPDVWFWEDGGENHPESILCNVVMSADTLRALVSRQDAPVPRWVASLGDTRPGSPGAPDPTDPERPFKTGDWVWWQAPGEPLNRFKKYQVRCWSWHGKRGHVVIVQLPNVGATAAGETTAFEVLVSELLPASNVVDKNGYPLVVGDIVRHSAYGTEWVVTCTTPLFRVCPHVERRSSEALPNGSEAVARAFTFLRMGPE